MTSTPANRAARLQLRSRLDLAHHASELLRHKEDALQREHTRLEAHAKRTEALWHAQMHEAATWLLRVRALGGSSELAQLVNPPQPATIQTAWQTAMGVTYPGTVRCQPAPFPQVTSTAAFAPSTTAYRTALEAAARHGAASAALSRVEAELANTRRRRRALEKHLQPRLRAQLHAIDLVLDEHERDAAQRTRIAARSREQT